MAGGAGNCIGDSAYIEAAQAQKTALVANATADAAIQVALALWQRNSSKSISNMQQEIANRNMELAERVHDHAKKFWAYEKNIVDDAFGEAKHAPLYDALSIGWTTLIDGSLSKAKSDWIKEAKKNCLSPTACEAARWDRKAQSTRADFISFANRQAEARAESLNERRYSRQHDALGIGRGILVRSNTFANLHATSGKSAGKFLIDSINSGVQALGLVSTRDAPERWGSTSTVSRMPFVPARVTSPARPTYNTKEINRNPIDPCEPPLNATQADIDAMAKRCPELVK